MTKRKVTVQEAAGTLGTSVDAVRQRIKRGKLERAEADDPTDNRVYVWLDGDQPESRHDVQGELDENAVALVETLREQVTYLRERLDAEREARTEERRRHDTLMAQLMQRIPELEASRETPGAPERAAEPVHREEPFTSEESTREPSERRSWWRRVFGGEG